MGPLNQLVLRMIAAYDLNKEVSLLDAADVIVRRLFEYDNGVYLTINRLQIEKRKVGSLSEEGRNELAELLSRKDIRTNEDEDDEEARKVLSFCASVLLDDLDEAIRTYSALNEWGRGNIDGYPIKALYDRAMKEMVKA